MKNIKAFEALDEDLPTRSQFVEGSFFSNKKFQKDPEAVSQIAKWIQEGKPLEVELGSGKGRFALQRAQRYDGHGIVAVDLARKWLKLGAEKAERDKVSNVLFIFADVYDVLTHYFDEEQVSLFHINFPDPWPKKRHQRRRMVNEVLLKLIWGRLKPGGVVTIATDFLHYMQWIVRAVENTKLPWEVKQSLNERMMDPDIKTSFERKYEQEGRDRYYMELMKP